MNATAALWRHAAVWLAAGARRRPHPVPVAVPVPASGMVAPTRGGSAALPPLRKVRRAHKGHVETYEVGALRHDRSWQGWRLEPLHLFEESRLRLVAPLREHHEPVRAPATTVETKVGCCCRGRGAQAEGPHRCERLPAHASAVTLGEPHSTVRRRDTTRGGAPRAPGTRERRDGGLMGRGGVSAQRLQEGRG
jgi:hypothetical protein